MDNDQDFECVHCGEYNPALDHWETCSKHPARLVVQNLIERIGVSNSALLAAAGYIRRHDGQLADTLDGTVVTNFALLGSYSYKRLVKDRP